eukprot:TRINITY_DN4473_c0_g1_i2.p2 TRINITY_DN4473_c0_g1~~TRINITY_DN4473_c0_g1_i2.p2  ORF type:complete len:276 (+),score=79.55 TRINITY_DN4473_c0_g1_i2:132-959(+)
MLETGGGMEEVRQRICRVVHEPFERSSIFVDLNRFVRKITVYNGLGEVAFAGAAVSGAAQEMSVVEQMRGFFTVMQRLLQLSGEENALTASVFEKHFIREKSDIQINVRGFLNERFANAPARHPLPFILRTLTQAVIAPAVCELKRNIGIDHPYKDWPSGWYININVESPTLVRITHKKSEQAHYPAGAYKFTWYLSLTLALPPSPSAATAADPAVAVAPPATPQQDPRVADVQLYVREWEIAEDLYPPDKAADLVHKLSAYRQQAAQTPPAPTH